MYEAEYRFALKNAGFDGFRVLLFKDSDGIKAASGEPGLKFTVDFGIGMLNAMHLGDVINDLIYQIRPYEVNKGETDRVFREAGRRAVRRPEESQRRSKSKSAAPEWAKPKFKNNKSSTQHLQRASAKWHEHMCGKDYLNALRAAREQDELHRSRSHSGEAGGEDHRRILGADHRGRRQLPHVRFPRARRRAGDGRADRNLGRVPDVSGQGARQGASGP